MRQSYRSDCLIKRFIFCLNVQRQVRILYKKKTCGNVHFTYNNPRKRVRDRGREKDDAELRDRGRRDRQDYRRNASKHRKEQKL